MDLTESPEGQAYRAKVAAWLRENAPPFLITGRMPLGDEVALGRKWQARKAQAGYGALLWPKRYGGEAGAPNQMRIFRGEEARYPLPVQPYTGVGLGMALPTLFAHAPEELIERFAGPTLRGELTWCQLFSEPSAGSDLAGLRTRATRTEGGWIINGQKVWNSFADYADWAILIARSDPSRPKHQGLTYFVVDMHSPGIEARPIRQMTGGADFCEVFLTDVFIPDAQQIGAEGEGWKVALTTLAHERARFGGSRYQINASTLVRIARETCLNGRPAIEDSAVRERIAVIYARERGLTFFGARLATRTSRGEPIGPEVSVSKLVSPRLTQDTGAFAMELMGYEGLIEDESSDLRVIHDNFCLATSHRIAGGADEIMRNQIAEKVLKLPQDARLDKGVPFDQLSQLLTSTREIARR